MRYNEAPPYWLVLWFTRNGVYVEIPRGEGGGYGPGFEWLHFNPGGIEFRTPFDLRSFLVLPSLALT